MPSTYTSNSGIELIDSGEQSGTWGDTTNTNLQIIDRLTNGVGSIALSGTTHTLTTSDGTLSDGHYKVLVFGGSPSGTNTVTVSPNNQDKLFFIKNNSGQSVIISQGSGANVTVANGATDIIYCDGAGSGAAVVSLSSDLSGFLTSANNLSDLASAVTALTNLGLTATAAEINVLDGITADTAELNILDGVTATTAELNILDGVTATTAELNILDGVTASAAELNYNDITTLGTSQASKVVTANPSGDVNLSGNLNILTQGDLRLQDSSGGEYAAIKSPTTISSSYTLSLPTASGTAGQVISTDGSGQLSFTSPTALGGLTALATVNASAGSSMVFDGYFSSSYDHYILRFYISTTSAQSSVLLRFSTGGVDLSNNYYYANFGRSSSGSEIANEAATATSLSMFSSHESGVGGGLVGQVLLSDPLNTNRMKVVNYQATGKIGSYASTTISGGGGNQSTSALSGLTLLVPAGTFDGTATLYGMGK